MIFGYASVSKREQNLTIQINAIKNACYEEIYQEKVSGRPYTSTVIFLQQYKNFVGFDLGFDTTNITNIRVQKDKAELMEKELYSIPEVTNIYKSFMVTSIGNNYYVYSKYLDQQDFGSWYTC
jgi:hypothetical protein